LQFQNRIAIEKQKPRIDFDLETGDRFSYENQDPILRSVCFFIPETIFQSRIDFKMKNGIRF